jgi:hypothetical protein
MLPTMLQYASLPRRNFFALVNGADSGPSRTVIPTDCGQRSGDCGQLLMDRSASSEPPGAATISAPPPTARSSRSCRTGSIALSPNRTRRTWPRSGTPTSAAVATTTEQLPDDQGAALLISGSKVRVLVRPPIISNTYPAYSHIRTPSAGECASGQQLGQQSTRFVL